MDYDCDISDGRNKRKHVTLTIQEKLDIINLVESGTCSRQTIANKYGIGKSTVHDIHKRRDVLKNFAIQNSTELSKRRRVDIKMETMKSDESFLFKDESNEIEDVEEETLVENFDHEEFDYNEQEYEIVYEPILCNSNEMINSKLEIPPKHDNESGAKRKSKTLTLKEKYDILAQLDEGKSVSAIIKKYEIGRTTIYDLKKQKQKIIEYMENSSGETRRTFKKSNYPEIENSLLEWCNSQDYFTEQEFYEKYKQLFVQLKSRNSSIQAAFSGSWSWCKRFFERNPEYKKKLTTSSKHLCDAFSKHEDENKSSGSEKFFSETDSINGDFKNEEPDIIKDTPSKRVVNYLSLNEKVQVLDEACAGKSIPNLANKYSVSKSTVYEILKKENEIRSHNSNDEINSKRKVIKSSRYPQIEKELIDWCLEQHHFPNYVSIADKALSIFESMEIKGDFNASSSWAKKFVERHPKLNKRYNERNLKSSESSLSEIIEEEENDQEGSIENIQEESLEFIEPDFMKAEKVEHDDYVNEYIIEELDENNADDLESINYDQEQKENKPKDEYMVSDDEALNSLKILMKYSEQRGHDEISRLLLEYQNIIEEESESLL